MTKIIDTLSLTANQFKDIMNEIWKYHRFGGLSNAVWKDEERRVKCKGIKYIHPTWDMRDGKCFYIQFRGTMKNGEVEFDFRDDDKPMYDRIMDWLNEGKGEK